MLLLLGFPRPPLQLVSFLSSTGTSPHLGDLALQAVDGGGQAEVLPQQELAVLGIVVLRLPELQLFLSRLPLGAHCHAAPGQAWHT